MTTKEVLHELESLFLAVSSDSKWEKAIEQAYEMIKAAEDLASRITEWNDLKIAVANGDEIDANGERILLCELRVGDACRKFMASGKKQDCT